MDEMGREIFEALEREFHDNGFHLDLAITVIAKEYEDRFAGLMPQEVKQQVRAIANNPQAFGHENGYWSWLANMTWDNRRKKGK